MKTQKLPNLLIVGAAKSGTTSLHNYLNQHSEVFMSKVKEPKYFSSKITSFPFNGPGDDLVEKEICSTIDSYQTLFKKSANQTIVGESSADNLYYSEKVIPIIKKTLEENTKIIIVLRNPISRAFSAYMHMRRDVREPENDFSTALDKEEKRIKDNFEFIWHYKNAGMYYDDVKNYKDNFKNVKIILTEELHKNTHQVLKDVCLFLNIDSSFNFTLHQKFNSSGEIKNKFLQNILTSRISFKRTLGHFFPKKIKDRLKSLNIKEASIPLNEKNNLILYFEQDILKLEKLIRKDLSKWLK